MLAAMSRTGLWKSVKKEFPLLENCTKNERQVNKILPYVATGDTPEISDLLAKSIDRELLAELEELVVFDGKFHAKIRFSDNLHTLERLVRSLFELVDKISAMTLSEKSRTAAKTLREVRETEDARRARIEKMKAEKYQAMTPEERLKHDKKVDKKELIKKAKLAR